MYLPNIFIGNGAVSRFMVLLREWPQNFTLTFIKPIHVCPFSSEKVVFSHAKFIISSMNGTYDKPTKEMGIILLPPISKFPLN